MAENLSIVLAFVVVETFLTHFYVSVNKINVLSVSMGRYILRNLRIFLKCPTIKARGDIWRPPSLSELSSY